jgi:hypothetical protein
MKLDSYEFGVFTMLLESFVIHKALVDKIILRTLKFEHVFLLLKPSSNVLKFIMGSNILHKKGHMCLYF